MAPRFDVTPLDHPITEVAGPLVAGREEIDFRQFGTGILAAPGLAFTARHVIDEIFAVFGGVDPGDAFGTLRFAVELGTIARPTNAFVRWSVKKFFYSKDIDIVALRVEPWAKLPPDFSYALPRFNALPPEVGESVWAFGFPRSKPRLVGPEVLKLDVDPRRTVGTVREVHPVRRDSSMLRFPCFLTDARFDPGMSGGPVFNTAGHICGLICSSLAPDNDDGEHSSYVSLMWPALGLPLVTEPELAAGSPMTDVLQLAKRGEIAVLNADLVSIERGAGRDKLHFGRTQT